MNVRRAVRRTASWIFGPTLTSQYLPALRTRRRSAPRDAKTLWSRRWDRVLSEGELDDASTIRRGTNPLRARYHYNAVENAILEHAFGSPLPERPAVLDVGAGAGHWIDFYRDVFDAGAVVGLEISSPAATALTAAYADVPGVAIVEADVAADGFHLGRRFDLVNAVDVLFHVVDDASWRRAVRNLAAHLEPGGRLLVAEHVGLVSHDAGFRRKVGAAAVGAAAGASLPLVTKRVRSAPAWRRCAREAGLTVVDSVRVRKRRAMLTPANRLLVLRRSPADGPAS